MMFAGGLGAAGAEVVIEAFLDGEEASFFALCDGTTRPPLRHGAGPQARLRRRPRPEHRRHGRLFAGARADAGAAGPGHARDHRHRRSPACGPAGTPYTGHPLCRPDADRRRARSSSNTTRASAIPRPRCCMPRLEIAISWPLFLAACEGVLDTISLRGRDEAALTVVMAAKGYPGAVGKGSEIRGHRQARSARGRASSSMPARSRTASRILANGGPRPQRHRARPHDRGGAKAAPMRPSMRIDWPEGFCRRRHRLARRRARTDLRLGV